MYDSYKFGSQAKELFNWLLPRADRQDLEAVKEDENFSNMQSEFHKAVYQASQVPSTETRHEAGYKRRVAVIEETLPDILERPSEIIGEYIKW